MEGTRNNQEARSQGGLDQACVMRKSQLSQPRKWLVEKMQDMGYGQIKQLVVIKGEPVVEPPPKITHRHKLTGPRRRPGTIRSDDYILKDQVLNLFDDLDEMGSGVVAVLDVRDGLPCELTLE